MSGHGYQVVLRLPIEADCGHCGITKHQTLLHGDDTLMAQPLTHLLEVSKGPFIYVLGNSR